MIYLYIPLRKKLLGEKVFMEFIFPIFLVSRKIKFRNYAKLKSVRLGKATKISYGNKFSYIFCLVSQVLHDVLYTACNTQEVILCKKNHYFYALLMVFSI